MHSESPSGSGQVDAPAFSNEKAVTQPASDLLLLVFIHGFKGDDETFLQFPQRMKHVLSDTIPDCAVESIVFPVYEVRSPDSACSLITSPELFPDERGSSKHVFTIHGKRKANIIIERSRRTFADWLTTLTVEREVASGGGAGKAKIVLCGHRYVLLSKIPGTFCQMIQHGWYPCCRYPTRICQDQARPKSTSLAKNHRLYCYDTQFVSHLLTRLENSAEYAVPRSTSLRVQKQRDESDRVRQYCPNGGLCFAWFLRRVRGQKGR